LESKDFWNYLIEKTFYYGINNMEVIVLPVFWDNKNDVEYYD